MGVFADFSGNRHRIARWSVPLPARRGRGSGSGAAVTTRTAKAIVRFMAGFRRESLRPGAASRASFPEDRTAGPPRDRMRHRAKRLASRPEAHPGTRGSRPGRTRARWFGPFQRRRQGGRRRDARGSSARRSGRRSTSTLSHGKNPGIDPRAISPPGTNRGQTLARSLPHSAGAFS